VMFIDTNESDKRILPMPYLYLQVSIRTRAVKVRASDKGGMQN